MPRACGREERGGWRNHGEDDCLQFFSDIEGWMNLRGQEMIGLKWLKEVG